MASRDLGELGDLGDQIGDRVDVAEAGGLEQAAGVDVVLAHQICDGAGDLDQAVDAASGDGAAALDQLGEGAAQVSFSIIVTPESIKQDVSLFLANGSIDSAGIENSLLAKLDAAATARENGNCSTGAKIYNAFINELQAQSGKHVAGAAASIMMEDAKYLIAHCP